MITDTRLSAHGYRLPPYVNWLGLNTLFVAFPAVFPLECSIDAHHGLATFSVLRRDTLTFLVGRHWAGSGQARGQHAQIHARARAQNRAQNRARQRYLNS